MPECNLPLPCSSTCTSQSCLVSPAFSIINAMGTAINVTGRTGISAAVPPDFPVGTAIQGSSLVGIGVLGTSAGPEPGQPAAASIGVVGDGFTAGVQGTSNTGRAGWFENGNTNNNNAALFAQTNVVRRLKVSFLKPVMG